VQRKNEQESIKRHNEMVHNRNNSNNPIVRYANVCNNRRNAKRNRRRIKKMTISEDNLTEKGKRNVKNMAKNNEKQKETEQ